MSPACLTPVAGILIEVVPPAGTDEVTAVVEVVGGIEVEAWVLEHAAAINPSPAINIIIVLNILSSLSGD